MPNIGPVKLSSPYVLAPMAGVNCTAFRLMCHEAGAGLVFTQMYHSDFICHKLDADGKKAVYDFINIIDAERPVTIQLVGSSPEKMLKAARAIEPIADIIDLNFGCSDADMVKAESGAYFLQHPELLESMVVPIVRHCKKPITAKIRIGWDPHSINGVQVAQMLQRMGLSAISVHGRVATQKYSGIANWEIIKHIKQKLSIPVIGNGDVRSRDDAQKMFERTGCDMVMVGRRAMGDPGVFARLNGQESKPDFSRFLDYYEKYDGLKSFTELKAHAIWFARRMRISAAKRANLPKLKTVAEIRRFFD